LPIVFSWIFLAGTSETVQCVVRNAKYGRTQPMARGSKILLMMGFTETGYENGD
jgi:hypothetical protein